MWNVIIRCRILFKFYVFGNRAMVLVHFQTISINSRLLFCFGVFWEVGLGWQPELVILISKQSKKQPIMNIDPQQLKKIRIRYLKCPKGDLHEGQVLNFICIDQNCQHKGLICPVCHSTAHQNHHILHLKVFLAQINANLSEKSELKGIGGYLMALDQTKRDMTKSLRDAVEQLSHKIREVQQKIEQGYCQLRRIILSQSTVSLRLPQLYRLLTEQTNQDENEIIKEISRYSQLLQFKNNKLIAVDSSKNLVEEYASKAGLLTAQLTSIESEVGKIFNKLPLNVDKFNTKVEEQTSNDKKFFSLSQKSSGVKIVDEKGVKLNQGYPSGLAFVDGDFKGKQVQSIAFKISEGVQGDYISLGVANPDIYKDTDYDVNLQAEPNLFGLCSFGFLQEELEGEAFMFSKGDTIDVTWTPAEFKLTFARRHSIEKCQTFVPADDDGSKLCFFVAMSSPEAKIELVE